jgi:hypothetical protein
MSNNRFFDDDDDDDDDKLTDKEEKIYFSWGGSISSLKEQIDSGSIPADVAKHRTTQLIQQLKTLVRDPTIHRYALYETVFQPFFKDTIDPFVEKYKTKGLEKEKALVNIFSDFKEEVNQLLTYTGPENKYTNKG